MGNSMEVPLKYKIELPYDLALVQLGLYPKEMKFACQRHICTAMLIAGQFTTVKK
jgi:hypothetical protein